MQPGCLSTFSTSSWTVQGGAHGVRPGIKPTNCKWPVGGFGQPQLYKFNGYLCVMFMHERGCNCSPVVLYNSDTILSLHRFLNRNNKISYVLGRCDNNPIRVIGVRPTEDNPQRCVDKATQTDISVAGSADLFVRTSSVTTLSYFN
jgi:hypothetical protein